MMWKLLALGPVVGIAMLALLPDGEGCGSLTDIQRWHLRRAWDSAALGEATEMRPEVQEIIKAGLIEREWRHVWRLTIKGKECLSQG
jgi:hypothetical protein